MATAMVMIFQFSSNYKIHMNIEKSSSARIRELDHTPDGL